MPRDHVEAAQKENVQVVREMLEDYLRGHYEAALPAFAQDVEVVTSLERFYGHTGVVEEAQRWEEMWSHYRFEVKGLVDAGDNVVLLYHQVGKAKESGIDVEERAGWVYTVREGKIARVEMFQDAETALRAAGVET
ncbi:MAG: nuclear transport factor 2 family protein [Thermoleophilaceae bacterium]